MGPPQQRGPTFASYRSGGQSAPDLAACSAVLARRARWSLGEDLGSDHLPMVVELRGVAEGPRRVRKTKMAYKKADWVAFRDQCEAALTGAEPPQTVQQMSTLFTETLQKASTRCIPRGARADPRPWALDPELQEAVAERREARRLLRREDPETKTRWIEAKRHASEVEERVKQESFRSFVSTTLNRPASLGRVSKLLKKWDRSTDDEHRDGQAMEEAGRLLITDHDKANAFVRTYAHVSRQVRERNVDRDVKKKLANPAWKRCRECDGGREDGCCGPFQMEELVRQIQLSKLKKSPGPDGISNEMLRHLGPVARSALLRLINASWAESEVPREWRTATVIPIPKSGKDKRRLASYRSIALTSHVGKLAERLILARLTFVAEQRGLIPPEQVGFREHRSVEDHIDRLIQEVQDGWQQPKPRRTNHPDGSTAQKYVLIAL